MGFLSMSNEQGYQTSYFYSPVSANLKKTELWDLESRAGL